MNALKEIFWSLINLFPDSYWGTFLLVLAFILGGAFFINILKNAGDLPGVIKRALQR